MTLPERQILEAARFLAAKGRHDVALALLDTVNDEALQVDAMLLRGKIHAQAGRYEEAIRLWDQVLAKSPGHREAVDAIRRARQMQKSRFASHLSRIRFVAAAGIVLCILLLSVGSFALGRRMTAGDHDRLQRLVDTLQADIRQISDDATDATAKALMSQAEQDRQALLAAIDTLQQRVQSLMEQQTTSAANRLDAATNGILAKLDDTQSGLATLRRDIAKAQTDVRADANDRWAEWARRVQEILTEVQTVHGLQTQIAEARAGDGQVLASVLQLAESLRQELAATQARLAQVLEAQAAGDRTALSLSRSVERLHEELDATNEQIARQRTQADQTLRVTVESLRPAGMDELIQQLTEAKEVVVALGEQERRLREKKSVFLALRRPAVQRKLREAEQRLETLQDQWDKEIAPWIKTRQALDPNGNWTEP